MNLKDKVVVITGGSRGLGRSMAELFIKEGATVVVSSKDKILLDTTAKEIKAYAIKADVTKEKDIQKLVDKTIKKFGRIDIWINNAGIFITHDFLENFESEKVKNVLLVNTFGTFLGCKFALKQMKMQKEKGVILNVISTSALAGRPKSSMYSASKWAVVGLTKAIQMENADSGVKILSVYPGGMKTKLFGVKKPADFDTYMEQDYVAEKVIANLKLENPEPELIIRRPNA
ncbi:hypothetical protein A2456_02635 [Candidatus Nomurabacteria bacterium RIFOXYC2_FULL_36_19]|uniref:Short-chain dehydrogenase n=1 Tax=Candidatus Nomurabacteria bacterium RIFOXYC2_FULL_36_19 TaxID=1801806 RepID=A0A1F6YWG4_9BACT|nr:MAG: hypothetical protein A2238_01285 [Candidatus Nomurabacteria bacterium RIFOXYA2_FULL_35_9]OGJ10610.1 MAG: hypothetical protein A2456_02635 [Candidatus Nomurabacteria bacterium RIFOXYC2_FULL_36_19]OGJ14089.1 MAG: hypothetical protein A2554_01050 [Candidatus Nomurabacteria bacterium RIFOXYD2_FULL_35_12]